MKIRVALFFSILIASISFNSCKKDEEPSVNIECTTDCFEISGVVINASTNSPEIGRNIKVQSTTSSFPYVYKELGNVITNQDGSYLIRFPKSSLNSSSAFNIILTLGSKEGYYNDFYFVEHTIQNVDVNTSYKKDITVYQKTTLELKFKNINPTDSVFLFDLMSVWGKSNSYELINKELAPGDSSTFTISTVVGLQTKLETMYTRRGSIFYYTLNDSIICNLSSNNSLEFNLD